MCILKTGSYWINRLYRIMFFNLGSSTLEITCKTLKQCQIWTEVGPDKYSVKGSLWLKCCHSRTINLGVFVCFHFLTLVKMALVKRETAYNQFTFYIKISTTHLDKNAQNILWRRQIFLFSAWFICRTLDDKLRPGL